MESLSRLYEYFFTAADVKVFLTVPGKSQFVNIDLLTGIGYDYNVSSIPIYTLGSSAPTFFSKGNTLGQGMFVIPFKNEQYLKVMLQHIFEEASTISLVNNTVTIKDYNDDQFRKMSQAHAKNTEKQDAYNINIGTVYSNFDIMIVLDNTSPFYSSTSSSIFLKGCKITGESFEVSSSQDQALQQGYKFYFKTLERGTSQ